MGNISKLDEQSPIREVIVFAISAGKIMLENGAETYRVEDTMEILCKSQGISKVQSFVIPTGIFLSVDHEGEIYTFLERVFSTDINLKIITEVNELSRNFVSQNLSIEDGIKALKKIKKSKKVSKQMMYLGSGIATSFFTLLFKGGPIEFVLSFILGMTVNFILEKSGKMFPSFFIKYIAGGLTTAFLSISVSVLGELVGISIDSDKIIIGVIMLLVPGVAITNAVRDTISGDYVSGLSRAAEALMIATAIAIGVGIVLNIFYSIAGGF